MSSKVPLRATEAAVVDLGARVALFEIIRNETAVPVTPRQFA